MLDHADQGLLAAAPVLDKTRHITALSQFRHFQLQRPQACVPSPVPKPVAVRRPFQAPLMRLRADFGRYLGFHNEIGNHFRHRP